MSDAWREALCEYVLRPGDTSLILGQRLCEWVGHAPEIEEDIGLANLALDLIGQARLFLQLAGELEGAGRGEDELAFLREEREFRNLLLAEQPNGDFGATLVRQLLLAAWQHELYAALAASSEARLREIAAKALKETRYHLRYASAWVVRLGDGTPESHERAQRALEELWRFTPELFETDAVEAQLAARGAVPLSSALEPGWRRTIAAVLEEATLQIPQDGGAVSGSRRGRHTEHLGYILAEMQHLQRSHPGAGW